MKTHPRAGIGMFMMLVAQSTPGWAQGSFQASFRPDASAGLFVGVREFVDFAGQPQANVTPVAYAVDDAVDLAHLFVYDLQLITAPRTVLALSGEPQKAVSRDRLAQLRAAGADVRNANFTTLYALVNDVRNKAEPEGILVASFATHGFEESGALLYAADTDPGSRRRTSISVVDVQEAFNRARTPRRILLIDACREIFADRTARAAGGSVSRALAEAMRGAAGTAMIMATTSGGRSYDDDERQNGVFTASFIEALRSNAGIQDDGLVTLGEAYADANARVREWVIKHNKAPASEAGISRDGDESAFDIPLRADAATQQRIVAERNRLFGVLQRDRDPAFIPDALLVDVQQKLASLTVARAKDLMISLQVFASSAGRESAGARSKAFLEWWRNQAPPAALTKAQAPASAPSQPTSLAGYQAQVDSVMKAITGGGATSPDKRRALNFESWFVCQDVYCFLNSVTRFANQVRVIRFGEKRDALNRTVDLPALAALPPAAAYPVPLRQGTKTIYAQLLFSDGTRSEVKSISVAVSNNTASGVELQASESPRGVTAPVAFANYVAGGQTVTITPDAPVGTDVLLYSFDEGGFFETPAGQTGFTITAPANTAAVRMAFRMSGGQEIGPFSYRLRGVEDAVSATTSSALSAVLGEAVVCTRVKFPWPPPSNLDRAGGESYKRWGMDLMVAGLSALTRGPAVACRPDQVNGAQYWVAAKEVQFGTAPGQLTEKVVLDETSAQKTGGRWLAELPASAAGIYVKVIFRDGKSSREVRLPIHEMRGY
jgi:hypothetical protein